MTRSLAKAILAKKLAIYFAEQGRFTTAKEFNRDKNRPIGTSAGLVKRVFGSWSKLPFVLETSFPDLWEMTKESTPEEVEVTSKQDPLEALRASSTEKTYE